MQFLKRDQFRTFLIVGITTAHAHLHAKDSVIVIMLLLELSEVAMKVGGGVEQDSENSRSENIGLEFLLREVQLAHHGHVLRGVENRVFEAAVLHDHVVLFEYLGDGGIRITAGYRIEHF